MEWPRRKNKNYWNGAGENVTGPIPAGQGAAGAGMRPAQLPAEDVQDGPYPYDEGAAA